MKTRSIFALLPFFLLIGIVHTAKGQREVLGDLIKLPSDYYIAFVSLQKDAPVQLVNIELLVNPKGGPPVINWTLKNDSRKTVRRFQVAFKVRTNVDEIQGIAGQVIYDIGINEATKLIGPGEKYTEFNYPSKPLPMAIRTWFNPLGAPTQKKYVIVYGRVKQVVFNDNTIFEDDTEIFEKF